MTLEITNRIIEELDSNVPGQIESIRLELGELNEDLRRRYWIDFIMTGGLGWEISVFTHVTLEEIQVVPKELVSNLKARRIPHTIIQIVQDENFVAVDKEITEKDL